MRLAVTGLVIVLVLGSVVLFTLHVLEEAESPSQQARPKTQTDRAAWMAQMTDTDWRRMLGRDGDRRIKFTGGTVATPTRMAGAAVKAIAHMAGSGPEEPLREESVQMLLDLEHSIRTSGSETAVVRGLLDLAEDPTAWGEQVRAIVLTYLVPVHQRWQEQRQEARAGLEAHLRALDSDAERKEHRRFFDLLESMPAPSQRTRDNWNLLQRVLDSRRD